MFFEKKLLIVDDSPIIRQLMNEMLTKSGYKNIDLVSNGKDDMLDDAFLETVFEIYNEIDYLNTRMTRQSVYGWEAIPFLEKILRLLEDSGNKEQIESVRKKLETLNETKPSHV